MKRKKGMRREDIMGIKMKVMEKVGEGIKKYEKEDLVIWIKKKIEEMVWEMKKL